MTKIMIVDDEPDMCSMLQLILEKMGHTCETAENGTKFLDKVDQFIPDLVLLDVMMPGLTIKEILQRLQQKKTKPKIIVLTVVRFSDAEKQQIFQLGNIVNYIVKPFDFDEFITAVNDNT